MIDGFKDIKLPHQKLNILFILRAPIGGLFRHVLDLAIELENRGHKAGMVIDGSNEYTQAKEWRKQMEQNFKLGIHTLPMSRSLGLSDFSNPFALNKLAHSLEIDVLHGQGAKGGFFARLARPKNSVAFYTPHGGVLNYDPKSMAGKIFRKIEALLMSRTDAIVFESGYAKDQYLFQIGKPKFPAPVVHNGLLEEEFLPLKKSIKTSDFAFIGELRSVKGIDYLIDALVDLKNSKGQKATLVIAGDGPLKESIKEQVKSLGLQSRVELLGVRSAREVLAMGRCLVIPSLKESLPYVLLEAAAANVPIITTNVGGIAEIFGPSADSLIEPANSEILKNAMSEFLSDEKKARELAKIRFEYVQKNFSVKKMVNEIEALYYSSLKKIDA